MKGAVYIYYQTDFLPEVNGEEFELQIKVFVESQFVNSWAQYNQPNMEGE